MKAYNSPLILIIDDEEAILKTLKDALTDESYRVEILNKGQKALELIGKLIPDLILLDIFMPNCNGLELLEQIKKEYPHQKIIMISGYGNIPIAIEAINKGAIDFIEKPFNLDDILNKLEFLKNENSITPNKINSKNNTTNLADYGIIGESNLFLELIQQIKQLAPYSIPILIYGEQGIGKTTLAKYIHKKSSLANRDFILTDCESLLKKDTYTIFEKIFSKKNITIYIKHIDSLDKNGQVILLHFLKNQRSSCLRIIASSRVSLFKLLQNNKFLSSLFYQLNRAPIEVPPLRKRQYDIPLLINHFLQKQNKKYNKKVILTTQSIRLLRNYQWPGNITELQHALQKIIFSCQDEHTIISPNQLFSLLEENKYQIIEEQSFTMFNSLQEATSEFEKNFLLYLLKKNHYNLEQVSNRLNLTNIELKNKLIKLSVEIPNNLSLTI